LLHEGGDVEDDPKQENNGLYDDEPPRAHPGRHGVSDPLPGGEIGLGRAFMALALAKVTPQRSKLGEQAFFGRVKLVAQVYDLFHGLSILRVWHGPDDSRPFSHGGGDSQATQRPFSRPNSVGADVAAPKMRCVIMAATAGE